MKAENIVPINQDIHNESFYNYAEEVISYFNGLDIKGVDIERIIERSAKKFRPEIKTYTGKLPDLVAKIRDSISDNIILYIPDTGFNCNIEELAYNMLRAAIVTSSYIIRGQSFKNLDDYLLDVAFHEYQNTKSRA